MDKNLDSYMGLPYTVTLKPYPDGGFFARVEELPGCMTEGDSLGEAMAMIEDAKKAWISTAIQDGIRIPEPESREAEADY